MISVRHLRCGSFCTDIFPHLLTSVLFVTTVLSSDAFGQTADDFAAAGALKTTLTETLGLEDVVVTPHSDSLTIAFHPVVTDGSRLQAQFIVVLRAARNQMPRTEKVHLILHKAGLPYGLLEAPMSAVADVLDGRLTPETFFDTYKQKGWPGRGQEAEAPTPSPPERPSISSEPTGTVPPVNPSSLPIPPLTLPATGPLPFPTNPSATPVGPPLTKSVHEFVFTSNRLEFRDAGVFSTPGQNFVNANFGARHGLDIGSRLQDLPNELRRAYVWFDVSQLAVPGMEIRWAKLEMFDTPAHYQRHLADGTATVNALRVLEPWNEGRGETQPNAAESNARGTISWSGQPRVDMSSVWARATLSPSATGAFGTWDVTNLVRAWLDGLPNHGLLLMGEGEGTAKYQHVLASRDHPQRGIRPRLRVQYATTAGASMAKLIQLAEAPSNLLLSEDFEAPPHQWSVQGQPPTLRDGHGYCVGTNGQTLDCSRQLPIEDFAVEFDACAYGDRINVLVANASVQLYGASIRRDKTLVLAHGAQNVFESDAALVPGQWQRFRFERAGGRLQLYGDGAILADVPFSARLKGPAHIGFNSLGREFEVDNVRFYGLSGDVRQNAPPPAETPTITPSTPPSVTPGRIQTPPQRRLFRRRR